MIKLFRNIRKKLVEQGKTTNYLKYAIGEIVLEFNCITNTFFEHFSFFLILEIKKHEIIVSLRTSIDKTLYRLS